MVFPDQYTDGRSTGCHWSDSKTRPTRAELAVLLDRDDDLSYQSQYVRFQLMSHVVAEALTNSILVSPHCTLSYALALESQLLRRLSVLP